MNYMKQLNAYYDWLQGNQLTTSAQLLYHTLLMINNKCGWIEWFQRTNQSICGLIGVNEKTLITARNSLKQQGLIDFISGKKKGDVTRYKIFPLNTNDNYTVNFTPEVTPQSTPQHTANTTPQTTDIYKLKQNELVDVVVKDADSCDEGLKKIQEVFSNNINPITPVQYQKLQDWLKVIDADAIIFAIEQAVLGGNRDMRYIEGILRKFEASGIKSRAQAEAQNREWHERKNKESANKIIRVSQQNVQNSKVKSFSNFKGRQYDSQKLQEALLNKSRSEATMSDEEFEKLMAERKKQKEC